jgi:hypothetical protein
MFNLWLGVEGREFSWRDCHYTVSDNSLTTCSGFKLENVPKDIFETPNKAM